MDIEQTVAKIVADATQYTRTMEQAVKTAQDFGRDLNGTFQNNGHQVAASLLEMAQKVVDAFNVMKAARAQMGGGPPMFIHETIQIENMIKALNELSSKYQLAGDARKRFLNDAYLGLNNASGPGAPIGTGGGPQSYLSGYNRPPPGNLAAYMNAAYLGSGAGGGGPVGTGGSSLNPFASPAGSSLNPFGSWTMGQSPSSQSSGGLGAAMQHAWSSSFQAASTGALSSQMKSAWASAYPAPNPYGSWTMGKSPSSQSSGGLGGAMQQVWTSSFQASANSLTSQMRYAWNVASGQVVQRGRYIDPDNPTDTGWAHRTMKGSPNSMGPVGDLVKGFSSWWSGSSGPGGERWWTGLRNWWGSPSGGQAVGNRMMNVFGRASGLLNQPIQAMQRMNSGAQAAGNLFSAPMNAATKWDVTRIAGAFVEYQVLHGVVNATKAAATSAIEMAASYEVAAVSFEVMLGSADKAEAMLDKLNKMAVETPFTSGQLLPGAKQLMAFGIGESNILPTLYAIGEVSAATGTSLERIILAYGQVQAAGRLMGQELRQFTDAGIPILEELGKVVGRPTREIKSMVQAGEISSAHVTQAFNNMTQAGGRYAGLMERISQTVQGRWTAVGESFGIFGRKAALAFFDGAKAAQALDNIVREIEIGKDFSWAKRLGAQARDLFETIKGGIAGAGKYITDHADQIKSAIGSAIIILIAYKAAIIAVKMALFALQGLTMLASMAMMPVQLAVGIGSLVGQLLALGPAGAAVVGLLATLAAGFALFGGLTLGNFDFSDFFSKAFDQLSLFTKQTKDTISKAWEGISAAMKTGDLTAAFEIASLGIQAIFHDLIGTLEAIWVEFLNHMLDAAIKAAKMMVNPAALVRGAAGAGDGLADMLVPDPFVHMNKAAKLRAEMEKKSMEAVAKQAAVAAAAKPPEALKVQKFGPIAVDPSLNQHAFETWKSLNEEIRKGLTPADQFAKAIGHITDAAEFFHKDKKGVLDAKGVANDPTRKFGIFKAFEALDKEFGKQWEQLPPLAASGSVAAQDIVNRSNNNNVGLQERMAGLLEAANQQAQARQVLMEAVVEKFEQMVKDGVVVVRRGMN